MNTLKTIIRLYTSGYSKAAISRQLGISRNTVQRYTDRFDRLKTTAEDLFDKSDKELHDLFQGMDEKQDSPRRQVLNTFFKYMEKELKKPGVTRQLMWEEYIRLHPQGYRRSQFSHLFRRYRGRTQPSFRVEHKAGDKMYVDYSGKKHPYVDRDTGQLLNAEVFVAILGASQYIYVQACASQKMADFIDCVQGALEFYQGVPQAIVPDNLKSAVTKSHRYEPTLNEVFADFAEHYQTVILPTRAYKPKDKALVEGAVKIVYRHIYAPLRNEHPLGLDGLNDKFKSLLETLNNKPLTGRVESRSELFRTLELPYLKSLPEQAFEIKETAWVTVMKTGHVLLHKDKHYYSVPYKHIGKKVKLVWSTTWVKVFYRFECLAEHKRVKSPYNYTTDENHLASHHKFITQWSPDYFIQWAEGIHPHVRAVIIGILERKKYPEQAYRSCMGVLSLDKKVGRERLIHACATALDYKTPSYKTVQRILELGIENQQEDKEAPKLPNHQNIRGNNYYQ